MLTLAICSMMSVNTRNGTLNYLFRKPSNAPQQVVQDITPSQTKLTVFLLSKSVVQNLNIILNVASNNLTTLSLLYDSTLGVTFEFITFKVECVNCPPQTFAPVLRSPQLGLFWCVFQLPKVAHILAPQFAAFQQNKFYVDQFFLEKSSYHTIVDNYVYASNYVATSKYGSVGAHVDESYAVTQRQYCLSCMPQTEEDEEFTLESQCTCGASGVVIGGFCYKTYDMKEPVKNADNLWYFITGKQSIRSMIKVHYKANLTEAITLAIVDSTPQAISQLTIEGEIVLNGTGSLGNQVSGYAINMNVTLSNCNTSLEITQINSGLKSSSLVAISGSKFLSITYVRLTGKLVCEGQSANEKFALFFITYDTRISLENSGIYGAELRVTANMVGLVVPLVNTGTVQIRYCTVSPLVPEEYRQLGVQNFDLVIAQLDDFPCFAFANTMLMYSVKMGNFLALIDSEKIGRETKLTITNGGGSEIGGLVGRANSSSFSTLQLYVNISITNEDTASSQQHVGFLVGNVTQSCRFNITFVAGKIQSNSNFVGILGQWKRPSYSQTQLSPLILTADVDITGNEHVGIIGLLSTGGYELNLMISSRITAKSKSGIIGAIEASFVNLIAIGMIEFKGETPHFQIGNVGENVQINKMPLPVGQPVEQPYGSAVNQCSDEALENRTELVITELLQASKGLYYATKCVCNVLINVTVKTQLSGKVAVSVFEDDSCSPSNLHLKGTLEVETVEFGTTELILSGLVISLQQRVTYLNTSLQLAHTGQNGTKHLTFLMVNATTKSAVQYIRISGSLTGDSKSDLSNNTEVGFIICYIQGNVVFTAASIGLYGVQIYISGMNNVGMVGRVSEGCEIYYDSLIVTNSSNNQLLVSQQNSNANFYYESKCAQQFSAELGASYNQKQYQTPFVDGTPSRITLQYRKTNYVGWLGGLTEGDFYSAGQINCNFVSIRAEIVTLTDSQYLGLAIGNSTGQCYIYSTYVSGNVNARHYAGVIGVLTNLGNVILAAEIKINGSSYLGFIAKAIDAAIDPAIYVDIDITFDQNYVGGIAAYYASAQNYDVFANIIARIQLHGTGKPSGLLYGWYRGETSVNERQDYIVNKC